MNTERAIKVREISKLYKIYDKPIDRLKESINPFADKYHKKFWALNNITFEINKGETVGIIGKNGSGKSTLLKIITGVLTPTTGSLLVNGKVSALLELGAGFNPELTGLENIYLNGTIMGYSKEEMDNRLDDILTFADIGEFIYQPVKMYSSGMFVRLAFSVATNVQPDILIVDEALAIGDIFFQAKSISRIRKMVDNGVTVLFVSHDTGAIKSICNRCILLNNGTLLEDGKSDKVIEKYFAIKVKSEQNIISPQMENQCDSKHIPSIEMCTITENQAFKSNRNFLKRASFQRIQNGKANFANIQLLDEKGSEVVAVEYEQNLILRMAIEICEDVQILGYGYHIRDKNGVDIVYSDSLIENKSLNNPKKGEKYIIDWKFKASLIQGAYNIACVLSVPINQIIGLVDFCDFVPLSIQFTMGVRNDAPLYGSVHWENFVEINKC